MLSRDNTNTLLYVSPSNARLQTICWCSDNQVALDGLTPGARVSDEILDGEAQ